VSAYPNLEIVAHPKDVEKRLGISRRDENLPINYHEL
jgi:hypothetical protein